MQMETLEMMPKRLITLLCCLLLPLTAMSADMLKPFILASSADGDMASAIADTRGKLEKGGFKLVGEYSPYAGATVIVVTNDELLAAAGKSDFGGYGAVMRTAITQAGDKVEVSYANPVYWGNAFRMTDLSGVAKSLGDAMNGGMQYGSEEGLTADKLRKYHYKILMPYFDDPLELGKFDSHQAALDNVNQRLASDENGLKKVFEVKVPGKDEVLFGVGMSGDGGQADKAIMDKIDVHGARHTAHLPYGVLVSGNRVYALPAEFRIALSFPDLSMMGKGSFMEIMDAPDAIEQTLGTLAK
jgi:hypothetical protein